MFFKIFALIFLSLTSLFSKQETLTIYDGMFKDMRYSGNIENGKLNGNGVLFCEEKPEKMFAKGNFINDELVSGEMYSCKDFSAKNEIKFGLIGEIKYERQYKPFYEFIIKGNFTSNKKTVGSLFNSNKDIVINFFNTQSYDKMIGKTNIMKDESAVLDGTLYLLNNKIQEIKTNFVIANLNFYGGEITIKGYDFILEGYTKNNDDINDFTFDGVIKWNNNTEYYLTNMRFKKDFVEKIESFKKLATPIKNYQSNQNKTNVLNNLKNETKIQNDKKLNINTTDIEFKNNKNYINNTNQIIDLEKR